MVSRSFAWLDENVEHSDSDYTRASALAKKWSELSTIEEERRFLYRESLDDYSPFEDCECAYCIAQNHDTELDENGNCSICEAFKASGLTECESQAAWNRERAERQAERDLEIELVEDKLALLGARIMRPYEHWNEDERLIEYMENRYDY